MPSNTWNRVVQHWYPGANIVETIFLLYALQNMLDEKSYTVATRFTPFFRFSLVRQIRWNYFFVQFIMERSHYIANLYNTVSSVSVVSDLMVDYSMKTEGKHNVWGTNHRRVDCLFNSFIKLGTRRKEQRSPLMAFCEGNPPVTGHKEPVMHTTFPYHDVIMCQSFANSFVAQHSRQVKLTSR